MCWPTIRRRDAVTPRAFETFEDVCKHRVLKTRGFFEIACVQTMLNRPLSDYLVHAGRDNDAHIPAMAASTFATATFEIGVVRQRDGTHKWHPLLNIHPI